nr:hypothetical protein [Bradyrhizobium japonicum]
MAKVPGFAMAFVGRRRIVETDNWDSDFLDLSKRRISPSSEIAFGALKGSWTCAMAPATDRPAPSSQGKGTTTTIRPAVADGL